MIINQILAITWFVICCMRVFTGIRDFHIARFAARSTTKRMRAGFFITLGVYFMVDLICIAASVLVLLGFVWARWFFVPAAIGNVLFAVAFVYKDKPLRTEHSIWLFVSVITLVLLFGLAVKIFHF